MLNFSLNPVDLIQQSDSNLKNRYKALFLNKEINELFIDNKQEKF